MIGLALDAVSATAAIQSDDGDFIFGPNTPMPDGGYREWLSAVPSLLASLPAADASMPVAVALPGIIRDETVAFTPAQHLEGRNVRRDLQSVLSREVSITGFGTALAAWHADLSDGTEPLAALWIGPSCHGGFIVGGRPVVGAHGAAGNWAHLELPSPVPYELDGRQCWCGRNGCLETFLSMQGLEEDYKRVSGMKMTAAEIAVAAEASDIVAENIIQVFEDRLGRATATIISLLDPRTIILGGHAPLPDRLCERVPRKWPGYVQIDCSDTQLRRCTDGMNALAGGAVKALHQGSDG
ncbi:MAG: ROK family protein [Pseudomonadota bacterium]|nr:ROK family protein [Pseudomonadota bacterium]